MVILSYFLCWKEIIEMAQFLAVKLIEIYEASKNVHTFSNKTTFK